MTNFKTLVFSIAIIILIICLILIGWALYSEVYNPKNKFPPIVGTCPDYFSISPDETKCKDKKIQCNNINKLGNSTFPTSNYLCYDNDSKATCEKLTDMNIYDLTWDGITNNKSLIDKCDKVNRD